jgi:hypothetical protein
MMIDDSMLRRWAEGFGDPPIVIPRMQEIYSLSSSKRSMQTHDFKSTKAIHCITAATPYKMVLIETRLC